jgi:hypothetical protein
MATPGRGIVFSTLGRAPSQRNQVFPYDLQRRVGTVILQECLEALGGRQIAEGEGALATILTPQHTIGLPERFLDAKFAAGVNGGKLT